MSQKTNIRAESIFRQFGQSGQLNVYYGSSKSDLFIQITHLLSDIALQGYFVQNRYYYEIQHFDDKTAQRIKSGYQRTMNNLYRKYFISEDKSLITIYHDCFKYQVFEEPLYFALRNNLVMHNGRDLDKYKQYWKLLKQQLHIFNLMNTATHIDDSTQQVNKQIESTIQLISQLQIDILVPNSDINTQCPHAFQTIDDIPDGVSISQEDQTNSHTKDIKTPKTPLNDDNYQFEMPSNTNGMTQSDLRQKSIILDDKDSQRSLQAKFPTVSCTHDTELFDNQEDDYQRRLLAITMPNQESYILIEDKQVYSDQSANYQLDQSLQSERDSIDVKGYKSLRKTQTVYSPIDNEIILNQSNEYKMTDNSSSDAEIGYYPLDQRLAQEQLSERSSSSLSNENLYYQSIQNSRISSNDHDSQSTSMCLKVNTNQQSDDNSDIVQIQNRSEISDVSSTKFVQYSLNKEPIQESENNSLNYQQQAERPVNKFVEDKSSFQQLVQFFLDRSRSQPTNTGQPKRDISPPDVNQWDRGYRFAQHCTQSNDNLYDCFHFS